MPSDVVKVTVVPFCGGVPLDSSTCAISAVVPLMGSVVALAVSVIVEPVGASSGTFWQATIANDGRTIRRQRRCRRPRADVGRNRDIMNSLTILIPMQLRGQARAENAGENGYAMAVLLIGLSVMAILMTIAMPVWKHDAQREKEAELVFRGEQYGRALSLFQRKHGPGTTPPTVDALLENHVLRKKYKDPITNDDFDVVLQGQNTQGSLSSTPQRGGAPTAPGGSPGAGQRGGAPGGGSPSSGPVGGIFGFASKSKAESIRIYKGRSHYNEWLFTAPAAAQAPGTGGAPGGVPGTGGPGGRGGPGQGPGGISGVGGPGGRGPGGPGGPGGRGITFGPNGQVIGPNGQPVIDPRTGQPIVLPPGARGGGRGPGR